MFRHYPEEERTSGISLNVNIHKTSALQIATSHVSYVNLHSQENRV